MRELIGHADVQTTERYVCSGDDDASVVQAPTPAAVKAFKGAPANVVPLPRHGGKRRS